MKHLKKFENSGKNITIIYGDDWEGIYYNGELLNEGHSINLTDVLIKLGYTIENKQVSEEEWEELGDSCPEKLEDVNVILNSKKYNL